MNPFIERPLGIHEEMFWHLDVAMPLNLTIAPKISGPLSLDHLRKSIDALQFRHPLLRACIISDNGIPYFRNCDKKIDLTCIDGDEASVNRIVDDYTNEVFDSTKGPLVKATLVKVDVELHYLVFGFHHSISDGRSMALLVRDLMVSLHQQDEGLSESLPELPLEPNYEASLPASSKGIRGYLKWNFVFLRLVISVIKAGAIIKGLPTKKHVPLKQRTMRTFHEYLEPSDSKRVFASCKQNQVTVHTAMHTAFALSAAELIEPSKNLPMFIGTIADVKSDMKPTASDATGLFAAVMGGAQKVNSESDFWTLAKKFETQLKQNVELNISHVLTKFQFKPINWLLRRLSDKNAHRLLGIVESMQPRSIPLSNLGLLRVLEDLDGVRQVMEIRGSVAVSILGNISGGAATMHDRIYTFVGASEPLVSLEQVQKYQKRANDILINACR